MINEINGQKLYYEKYGSGKPILMIHGNGESHAIFNKSVNVLKNHFTVYTLDSRGHGNSGLTNEHHYIDMAEDCFLFIKNIIKEKTVFYGFSDGGIIGLLLAINHQNVLDRLIVSGANTNPDGIKTFSLLGMKIKYFLTHSSLTKMMLNEPNITEKMLSAIKIPTNITCGEYDLIKLSDTKKINAGIKNSTLKVFKGETHGSYIVNSRKIADYIIEIGI